MPIPVLCDASELADECSRRAQLLGLKLTPQLADDPIAEAIRLLEMQPPPSVGLALAETPKVNPIVRLAELAFQKGVRIYAACVGPASDELDDMGLDLASDLGVAWVEEIRPLVAALALHDASITRPWTASTRSLSTIDRKRLGARAGSTKSGRWQRQGELLALEHAEQTLAVGEPPEVATALHALQRAERSKRPAMPRVEGVDPATVRDVILGPARALSDPASKAALEPYDVPFPVEELCGSPSRAASEATRIGYPVRLALASPDLRVWDHPDLAADTIDNAARVRDVFRQVMALAHERAPEARLLGVTVSAATPAQALLELRLKPLDEGLVLLSMAFADSHGRAARDRTRMILPATSESIATAIRRLRGWRLLLGVMPNEQTRSLGELADVLLRLAAFVHEWRDEIEHIAVQPLAILPGGEVEAREVCVQVSDAFSRSLEVAAGL